MQRIVIYAANLFFIGLLALCGANVATLVFARTVTRDAEISVRTALGASRAQDCRPVDRRSARAHLNRHGLGLAFAYYGLQWVKQTIAAGQGAPVWFWWNDRLSPESIAYALVLAVIAALIVGGIPGLKATGARVQDRLKHATRRLHRGPEVRRCVDRRDRVAGGRHGGLSRRRHHAGLGTVL